MKTPHIVVVGSVNTDMVVKGSRLPAPGETVTGGRFVMAAGGKGANQAVAAARLGAEVTLVAKVGRDIFGDQAIENFRREGILTDHIVHDSEKPTGVALILVDDAGENLISVASGANHALSPEDLRQAAECIRSADMVMLQLEIPLDTVCAAARIAAEAGVPVMLDPAPAPTMPLPDDLCRYVTYLTPNETEAEQLTAVPVNDEITARRAADRLLASGSRHVIVTLGAKGAVLAGNEQTVLIPTQAVNAMDTTAAGDAFNGALAWALGSGMPLKEAVQHACQAGALSATRLGAQPSLPTHEELIRFLERQSSRQPTCSPPSMPTE
jgi:ribokinase